MAKVLIAIDQGGGEWGRRTAGTTMRASTTQITTIAAATASWGVVSGFGLFAKLWPEGRDHPLKDVVLKLFVVLALAVVVAAFLDWLKEHLSDEPYRPRAWSMSRVLTAVVILASFELVAVALDNVVETWWERRHEVAVLAAVVTSPEERWAFIVPDDILDARAMRAALFGPRASRAARRVRDVMPSVLRDQVSTELNRDDAIAEAARAWSAWRKDLSGALTDRLMHGTLSPMPAVPPLRSREEVTEGRRILAEALNAALIHADLFREQELDDVTGVRPLTRAFLIHPDAKVPVRTLVRLNRSVLERTLSSSLRRTADAVTLPAWVDVVGLIGLWGAAGAVLGGVLSLTIAFPAEAPTPRFVWSIVAGTLAGGIVVPCLVPVYLLIWRLVAVGWLLWTAPADAALLIASYHLDKLPGPFVLISVLFSTGRWGVALLLVAFVVAVSIAARGDSWVPVLALGAVLAALTVPVLFDWTVLRMAKSMANVWLVPGITLGALVPLLRRGRGFPRVWGAISLGAAVVLAGLTSLRLAQRADVLVLLGSIVVAGLVVAGLLLQRQWLSWEAWPVVAVSLGIIVGSEIHALHATFRDVLGEVTQLTEKISPRAEVANLSMAAPLGRNERLQMSQTANQGPDVWGDLAPLPEPRDRAGAIYLPADAQGQLQTRLRDEAAQLADFTRVLEITLVASLGFWATTGLLAAWKLQELREEVTAEH